MDFFSNYISIKLNLQFLYTQTIMKMLNYNSCKIILVLLLKHLEDCLCKTSVFHICQQMAPHSNLFRFLVIIRFSIFVFYHRYFYYITPFFQQKKEGKKIPKNNCFFKFTLLPIWLYHIFLSSQMYFIKMQFYFI